ncbi:MAG TPA: DUF6291 domain-containing protein [Flavobacterium sp.]
MNKGKKFSLKQDLIHAVSQMPDNKAGKLFKHILYFVNDKSVISNDLVINLMFEPIKEYLLEEIEKEKAFKEHCREAGKKSAEAKKNKIPPKIQPTSTDLNQRQPTLTDLNQPSGKLEKKDYEDVVDYYHENCAMLPKVIEITQKRINLIDNIFTLYKADQVRAVFDEVAKSDFLKGKKTSFRANFNWLLNPNNFLKVLEGNYKDSNNLEPEPITLTDQWEKAKASVKKHY